jgi:ParB family transcriptional regulator, chromosome partitioning protein
VVTDTQELDDAVAAAQPGDHVAGGEMPAQRVLVDPRSLVVDANVRSEVLLDRAFVGSVKDLGVLVPISARRCEGGVLKVVLGQRRTLAAVEAGRELVPVFVIDAPDEEKAAEIARIVEQVVENDQRAALPDADRAGAFEQLSLLGLSAAQIARRTRTPVRAVRTALEVTGSAVAAGAMRRHDLTLEQAAVIAEFDGDSEAVEALTAAVQQEPERFEHVVQRLRDDRAERVARVQVAESVGVPIVEQPGYGSSSPVDIVAREGAGQMQCPQRDSNPCYRLERAAAPLDQAVSDVRRRPPKVLYRLQRPVQTIVRPTNRSADRRGSLPHQ